MGDESRRVRTSRFNVDVWTLTQLSLGEVQCIVGFLAVPNPHEPDARSIKWAEHVPVLGACLCTRWLHILG